MKGLLVFKDNPNTKSIFSLETRDNLSDHWVEMRNYFFKNGIDLVAEYDEKNPHDFEIHIDVNDKKRADVPCFLLIWENKNIFPKNIKKKYLYNRYERIFSNDPEISNSLNTSKFFIPVMRSVKKLPDGFKNRKILVVMIANNKSFPNFNLKNNLYRERVKTIKWFEKNFPEDFCLYGTGWNMSARMPYILGSMIHKIEKKIFYNKFKFKSWKGAVDSKKNVLINSKFSIVYENVLNQKNYITEKIFDSFSYGNVPIYLGCKNIFDYIPKNCFIDRRDFNSLDKLYLFLNNMKEENYIEYQNNILNFLKKEKNGIFSIKNFIETVPKQIIFDLQKFKINSR